MKFQIGQRVRYKPGYGTYGYEDVIEADGRADGRISAEVVGVTRTRIRIKFLHDRLAGRMRAVDEASLTADA